MTTTTSTSDTSTPQARISYCYNHPKRKTTTFCSRCDRPICHWDENYFTNGNMKYHNKVFCRRCYAIVNTPPPSNLAVLSVIIAFSTLLYVVLRYLTAVF